LCVLGFQHRILAARSFKCTLDIRSPFFNALVLNVLYDHEFILYVMKEVGLRSTFSAITYSQTTQSPSTMDIILTLFLCKRYYQATYFHHWTMHGWLHLAQLERCTPILIHKILAHFLFCSRNFLYLFRTS